MTAKTWTAAPRFFVRCSFFFFFFLPRLLSSRYWERTIPAEGQTGKQAAAAAATAAEHLQNTLVAYSIIYSTLGHVCIYVCAAVAVVVIFYPHGDFLSPIVFQRRRFQRAIYTITPPPIPLFWPSIKKAYFFRRQNSFFKGVGERGVVGGCDAKQDLGIALTVGRYEQSVWTDWSVWTERPVGMERPVGWRDRCIHWWMDWLMAEGARQGLVRNSPVLGR